MDNEAHTRINRINQQLAKAGWSVSSRQVIEEWWLTGDLSVKESKGSELGDEFVDYALEGSVFIGGAVVQWLRDGLHLIRNSSEIEALASQVKDTDGVYLVPAFAGLGAPYWNPEARGSLFGLTRGTQQSHIARAALEGIAFQVFDLLKAMEKDGGIAFKEIRVDGVISFS